jgi:hypothetical protein
MQHAVSKAHDMEHLVSGTLVVPEMFLEQLLALPATHPQLVFQLDSAAPGYAPGVFSSLSQGYHTTGDHSSSCFGLGWVAAGP